jgi:hypothetical protein
LLTVVLGTRKRKPDISDVCKKPVFGFPDPEKYPELRKKWIRFVNRHDWVPSEHSGS